MKRIFDLVVGILSAPSAEHPEHPRNKPQKTPKGSRTS